MNKENKQPLVTIVTPTFNSEKFIKHNLDSVANQTYSNIEHIIIDGKSTDNTLNIIQKNIEKIDKLVSEKDKGIFDAMNKGIELASGEIIGILNSDDLYYNNQAISRIVDNMQQNQSQICWGDLVYVKQGNTDKNVRYWQTGPYKKGLLKKAWIPPHPTTFIKKQVYQKYGKYKLDYPIAADYELLFRMVKKYKIKTSYIPRILVKMRYGGSSNKSLTNIIKGNKAIIRTWKENGFKFPYSFFFWKIFEKLPQFLKAKNLKAKLKNEKKN